MALKPVATDKRAALVAEVRRTEMTMLTAQSAHGQAVRALEDYDLELTSTEGQSIGTTLALDANLNDNRIGLKYLRERLERDWSESYLRFKGSMLVNIHQYSVSVAIPHDASMERIRATAAAIEEIVPFITPGASASVGKPHFADFQTILIEDSSCSGMTSWCLGYRDGEWSIFDGKRYSYEPRFTGDLEAALCVIAKQLPADI